jgi:3-oxoadipate enol-lactonase
MIQTRTVNGIELAFRIDGDRSPHRPWLVFAHSLACDHTMWDAQAQFFTPGLNVLRVDLRGHGKSSAPAGAYTLEQLADDLKGLLGALKLTGVHYVGLSLGGMIGQVAALRYPLLFRTLTLANTSSRYPEQMKTTWDERIAAVKGEAGMNAIAPATIERWFTPYTRATRAEDVARIAAQIRATPINGYIGCAQAIARLNLTARLDTIACPTLVIAGADDPSTPPAMAEEIVRAIPGARLTVIPDCAHLSAVERPEAFNAALREFLAGSR